jgi:hypothetical protein
MEEGVQDNVQCQDNASVSLELHSLQPHNWYSRSLVLAGEDTAEYTVRKGSVLHS